MNKIKSQFRNIWGEHPQFPLPLKFSIPVFLTVVTVLASIYSYQQEVATANQRVTQQTIEQAKFLGSKTSALLEFIYRNSAQDDRDLEGANLAISQIGGEPNLKLALLMDETNTVILSTRYELRGWSWQSVFKNHEEVASQSIRARHQLTGQIRLTKNQNILQVYYPVTFAPEPGTLRSSSIGILVLEYDLFFQKELTRQNALWRVLQTDGILAILYFVTWLFFDKFITRRVKKITDGIDLWAKGELSTRIVLDGSDELFTMAAAFNRMADQIQTEAQNLNRSNQTLAKEIQQHKQTEITLRETEKQFRLAIENAPFPIMLHVEDGAVLQLNQSWITLSEYTPELIPTVSDWISFAQEDYVDSLYDQRSLTPQHQARSKWNEGEVPITTLSGRRRRWDFQSASLGHLADGQHLIISMAADITQREEAKQRLQKVEHKRQAAEKSLRQVIEGVAPITGKEFFSTLANQIAEALEVRFVSITQTTPKGFQILAFCPEGELQARSFFPFSEVPCCEKALRDGEFCVPDGLQNLYPNNELFTHFGVQSYLGIALRTRQGQTIGNLCFLHDQALPDPKWAKTFLRIFAARAGSELERYQTSLKLENLNQTLEKRVLERTQQLQKTMEELQAFKAAIDQSAIVATTDINGVITSVNDSFCQISGYTREELIGKTHRLVNSKHHSPGFFQELWQTISDGQLWRGEVCNQAKDGSLYWVDSSIIPIIDENKQPYQFLAIRFDITQRKKIEGQLNLSNSELLRATRLKDEFLANMNHELRTPLNSILGLTEALQEEVFGEINEIQCNMLQTVESSGAHLLELINEILDLAKVESGKIELELQSTNIAPLCQLCLTFIKQQAYKKRIKVHNLVPDDLPEVLIDERRIRQVLINLLNNAVKFTPNQGEVKLLAEYNPVSETTLYQCHLSKEADRFTGFLKISIVDTGIGIAPEHLDHLFQPFIQIDSALNRQYNGTGLGLALVKSIVELHGGLISLKSEVDVGSCFEVEIPCYRGIHSNIQSTEPIKDQTTLKEFPTRLESPKSILLVEDNESNIVTIANYLSAQGYTVQVANTGLEAIHHLIQYSTDLILMDIQMPEMDGFETIRKIRDEQLSSAPIIALTALAMKDDQTRCIEAGANAYISKPVKLKLLAAMIHNHLQEQPKSLIPAEKRLSH